MSSDGRAEDRAMKMLCLLLVPLISVSGPVMAKCPAGIASAGNPACIPPDRSNSSHYQANQGAGSVGSRAIGHWEDRWGAFAIDLKVGLGASKDMRSKRAAERAALAECAERGGLSCKVQLSYHNQCGVIIAGDSGFNTSAAATVERASRIGMERCVGSGDSNCHVYYFDCSPPVLIAR